MKKVSYLLLYNTYFINIMGGFKFEESSENTVDSTVLHLIWSSTHRKEYHFSIQKKLILINMQLFFYDFRYSQNLNTLSLHILSFLYLYFDS